MLSLRRSYIPLQYFPATKLNWQQIDQCRRPGKWPGTNIGSLAVDCKEFAGDRDKDSERRATGPGRSKPAIACKLVSLGSALREQSLNLCKCVLRKEVIQ